MKFDTTRFAAATIKEIGVLAGADPAGGASVVVSLFLQSWRATLIVVLAIPVVTDRHLCGALSAGLQRQHLSLFAIILALTMVVDDAIVVVEECGNQNGGRAGSPAGHRPGRCGRSPGR
ncbi:efflux RND transporter permease subunit [Klebsiella pneumoniae subsp. pneumoniae]|nr:efflux RND transporter permease subunit [Klebsiella pneumoniae subsp. pneumoniae]